MKIGKWNAGILSIDTTKKDEEDIALHTQNFLFELSQACYYAARYCEHHEMKYSSKEYYQWWKDFYNFLKDCGYFDCVKEEK